MNSGCRSTEGPTVLKILRGKKILRGDNFHLFHSLLGNRQFTLKSASGRCSPLEFQFVLGSYVSVLLDTLLSMGLEFHHRPFFLQDHEKQSSSLPHVTNDFQVKVGFQCSIYHSKPSILLCLASVFSLPIFQLINAL